jgi:hypothetical protein
VVGSVRNGAIDPTPIDLILPVRGRARAEILARTLPAERYAASIVRQRAVTEGLGKDGLGGITFRPGRQATPPERAEALPFPPRKLLATTRYGWSSRADTVSGGLAWTQWLATLTGESPTSSLATARVSQTYKHGERVWSRGGAAVGPTGYRSGDGSCSGVATPGERSIRVRGKTQSSDHEES